MRRAAHPPAAARPTPSLPDSQAGLPERAEPARTGRTFLEITLGDTLVETGLIFFFLTGAPVRTGHPGGLAQFIPAYR